MMNQAHFPAFLLALSLLLFSACSPLKTTTTTERQAERQLSGKQAVNDLIVMAQNQSLNGQHEQAKSTLERALRLDSNNANLWYELALISGRANNLLEARQFAERAQSLSRDKTLDAHIKLFIEQLDTETQR